VRFWYLQQAELFPTGLKWAEILSLSLAKMPYGVNAFEISDNQER